MELYRKIHTPQALVKDVSVSSRTVSGYFSSFDNVDSDGDAFAFGSYAKSISENGPNTRLERIAYLHQHNVHQPVGKLKVLEEQNYKGLFFEGAIPDTTLGTDTLKLYDAGILKEHSVGISIIKEQKEGSYNLITEAKLWEGSVVTWGANQETPFLGFKNLTKEEASTEIEIFTKAIRNGSFTDKTFNLLEIGLEQIKAHIDSLEKPSVIDTFEPNELLKHFTAGLKL